MNTKLAAEGLAISDKCETFRISNNSLSAHIGFPLVDENGKKPKHGKPSFLFLTFCPFCGEKYEQLESKEAA